MSYGGGQIAIFAQIKDRRISLKQSIIIVNIRSRFAFF